MSLVDYLGQGGLEVGGSAIAGQNTQYWGDGGVVIGGSAVVSSRSLVNVSVVGTGGIRVGGQGLVNYFQSGGIIPNDEFWSIDPEGKVPFLYQRVQQQVNGFVARDSGPIEFGNLTQGLIVSPYTLRYVPGTGEFQIEGVTQFIELGARKVDLTFDVWGYPFICWITANGNLAVRYWNIDVEDYQLATIEFDCSDCYCCLAERRMPWSYRNNKIYVVYIKDGAIFSRNFQDELFGLAQRTEYSEVPDVEVSILGFGLTEDYTLQIISKHKQRS